MIRAATASLAVLAASCTVVPAAEQPQAVAAKQGAPAPALSSGPSPAPTPVPAPVPAALPPATFAFSGELTQGGWIRGVAPAGTVSLMLGDAPVPMAADGSFLAAFDRDAGRSATLVATRSDGTTARQPLTVSPRDWNIEHINAARRAGGASESFMQRRRPELERIHAARAMKTDAAGWRQDFIWPVKGRISGRFGSQRIYRGEPGSSHTGIDIAPGAGTPYVAPADGVVVLAAGDFSLEGNLLIIDHGNGLNSAFLHSQRLDVKQGDHVKQGQQLGLIGSSGRATGPHLHWSLMWGTSRLDPLLFTGPQG
jgi:murein DD-endopeptidase MepM/ murein hydrolase activator NlpD